MWVARRTAIVVPDPSYFFHGVIFCMFSVQRLIFHGCLVPGKEENLEMSLQSACEGFVCKRFQVCGRSLLNLRSLSIKPFIFMEQTLKPNPSENRSIWRKLEGAVEEHP